MPSTLLSSSQNKPHSVTPLTTAVYFSPILSCMNLAFSKSSTFLSASSAIFSRSLLLTEASDTNAPNFFFASAPPRRKYLIILCIARSG